MNRRQAGGILIKFPNHLSQLISVWRSSGFTPSFLQMYELLSESLRLSPATLQKKLSSATCICKIMHWSWPKSYEHRWELEHRWTMKPNALPFSSVPSSYVTTPVHEHHTINKLDFVLKAWTHLLVWLCNSIQFNFIYIVLNHNKCHLKALQ